MVVIGSWAGASELESAPHSTCTSAWNSSSPHCTGWHLVRKRNINALDKFQGKSKSSQQQQNLPVGINCHTTTSAHHPGQEVLYSCNVTRRRLWRISANKVVVMEHLLKCIFIPSSMAYRLLLLLMISRVKRWCCYQRYVPIATYMIIIIMIVNSICHFAIYRVPTHYIITYAPSN